jgi:hypothetical protein
MMTASGFQKLAEAMKAVKPLEDDDEIARRQWFRDLEAICKALRQDNPSFNPGLFLAESGRFDDL